MELHNHPRRPSQAHPLEGRALTIRQTLEHADQVVLNWNGKDPDGPSTQHAAHQLKLRASQLSAAHPRPQDAERLALQVAFAAATAGMLDATAFYKHEMLPLGVQTPQGAGMDKAAKAEFVNENAAKRSTSAARSLAVNKGRQLQNQLQGLNQGIPVKLAEVATNAYLYGVHRGLELVSDPETVSATAPNTVRGDAFEQFSRRLLEKMYPNHVWYHQGRHKKHERGLDLIGTAIDPTTHQTSSIGVQVKLHQPDNPLKEPEWRNFLAGCFSRRVDTAIFITTGRLTGDQRREAQEAGVMVIEGVDELNRMCETHGLERFDMAKMGEPT